jgi:hypothetical protein
MWHIAIPAEEPSAASPTNVEPMCGNLQRYRHRSLCQCIDLFPNREYLSIDRAMSSAPELKIKHPLENVLKYAAEA